MKAERADELWNEAVRNTPLHRSVNIEFARLVERDTARRCAAIVHKVAGMPSAFEDAIEREFGGGK